MVLIFRHLNVQIKLTSLYDNFIANITHELKSPLSSIQLYLETLMIRDVTVEKQKEFLKQIFNDTKRLQNLINSILEISALENKKRKDIFSEKSAKEFFIKIIKNSAANFKSKDEALSLSIIGDCKIKVDEQLFKMVFDNLIDNSIKYSINELKISVLISCNEKNVEIYFKDNGIGIELNKQKNIFKKFYRIYANDIPNVRGTGLGLYWVREIIKNHRGNISVFSEGIGRGATFKIVLPAYRNNI